MQIARWGNSLAVRLPARLVEEMGLREGDDIELTRLEGGLAVFKRLKAEEALERLIRLAKEKPALPEGYRFDRDEANAR
jgi:antitoxin MazE